MPGGTEKKRVLMLTTDIPIDRRIVTEAETLEQYGYTVHLIARSENETKPVNDGQFSFSVLRLPKELPRPKAEVSEEKALYRRQCILTRWEGKKSSAKVKPVFYLYCAILALLLWTNELPPAFVRFSQKVKYALRPNPFGLSNYDVRFYRAGRRFRPDILHVHDYPLLAVGVALKRKLGIPLVYDMHEYFSEQPPIPDEERPILKAEEKRLLKEVDCAITVNDLLGEHIKAEQELDRIYIVQNAVSTTGIFQPGRHYNRFREEYPELEGRLLLMYQGFMFEKRNLEVLIEGMALVKNKQWMLLFMGFGYYKENLARLIEERGLQQMVRIMPSQPQDTLYTYLASVDVGIIPYSKNNDINTKYVSPNKLYEFAAVQLPIISNDLPFAGRVVGQYGFGLVTDIETPQRFADAVDTLTPQVLEAAKEGMAKNAHFLLWEEEKEKLLDVYCAIDPDLGERRKAAQ